MNINNVKGQVKSLFNLYKITKISNYFLSKIKQQTIETNAFVENVAYRHDCPQGDWVPPHLKDTLGSWQRTKTGFPVSGQVLPREVSIGSDSPVLPLLVAMFWANFYLTILLVKSSHPIIGFISIIPIGYLLKRNISKNRFGKQIFSAIAIFCAVMSTGFIAQFVNMLGGSQVNDIVHFFSNIIPVFMPYIFYLSQRKDRARLLAKNGNDFSGAVTGAPKTVKNELREIQALNVVKQKRDGATYIEIGKSTGVMSGQGDEFSPDRGLSFGLDTTDIKKHGIYFGSTGKGKSSALALPILNEIFNSDCGLFLADGKNDLPVTITHQKLKLISPETVINFNFLEGLSATQKGNIFREAIDKRKEGDQNAKFSDKSEILLNDLFIIHEALFKYELISSSLGGLLSLYKMYKIEPQRDKEGKIIIEQHSLMNLLSSDEDLRSEITEDGTPLYSAFCNLLGFHDMDSKEKGLITFSVDGWLMPFSQNPLLSNWVNSETSDVDLRKMTVGEQFALCLPNLIYGLPGIIITKLIQSRNINILSSRGTKWSDDPFQKHVFMITDECQDVYDKSVVDSMATMRGFGGTFIAFTQNYESLELVLTPLGAAKLLDGFSNFGTFKSSPRTYEIIGKKVGDARIWTQSTKTEVIDYSMTAKIQMSNSVFDVNNPEHKYMLSSGMGTEIVSNEGLFSTDLENNNEAGKGIFTSLLNIVLPDRKSTYSKKGISTMLLSEKPVPVFNDKITKELDRPFACFLCLDVGNVPRRDVIDTEPLMSDFSSLKDKIEKERQQLKAELGIS